MIKSDINLELNYSNSEGILNEHKDNNYVYNFTENSKFSVKSLKTNKVDHNGYYTKYDDYNIVLISNGGKKYESMSYKLTLDLNINNEFEEEITCNFQNKISSTYKLKLVLAVGVSTTSRQNFSED